MFEIFGGFRKLREACGKNFHPISCKSTSAVTSYDQQTKKVHEEYIHTYWSLSETLVCFKHDKPGVYWKHAGRTDPHLKKNSLK